MSGFTEEGLRKAIIDKMEDNTVAILANAKGARIYAKFRGCTAREVGFMLGAIRASLDRKTQAVLEQIHDIKGEAVHDEVLEGIAEGMAIVPDHEGIRINELGDRNG